MFGNQALEAVINACETMPVKAVQDSNAGNTASSCKINFWGAMPRNEIPCSHIYLMNKHDLTGCTPSN